MYCDKKIYSNIHCEDLQSKNAAENLLQLTGKLLPEHLIHYLGSIIPQNFYTVFHLNMLHAARLRSKRLD